MDTSRRNSHGDVARATGIANHIVADQVARGELIDNRRTVRDSNSTAAGDEDIELAKVADDDIELAKVPAEEVRCHRRGTSSPELPPEIFAQTGMYGGLEGDEEEVSMGHSALPTRGESPVVYDVGEERPVTHRYLEERGEREWG